MRTTLAVGSATRDRLNDLRRKWKLASVEAVLERLLDGTPQTAEALYAANRGKVDAALRRHGVRKLVAFGSRARGAAGPESDLDLAVAMPEKADLFDLVHLKDDLEAAFGLPVDVVSMKGARPRLRQQLEREGVVLVG